jgi:transposase
VSEATALAGLLGLSGVEVDLVEREGDGWTVHLTTAPGQQACCPGCGQAAARAKQPTAHSVRHLAVVPVRVTWHKSRLWCDSAACQAGSLAEAGPVAQAGAGVSTPAKTVMGHLVGDWLVAVSRVAAGAGVSWHTAHGAFAEVAAQAGIHLTDTDTADDADDADADADADADTDSETEAGGCPAQGRPACRPSRWASGLLPPVEVLGTGDHRRGKPLYHRDPASGAWVADADRWQSVFVDSAGGHGLLGQVEGRAKADVTSWLAAQDPAWRAGVRYAATDMSTVYKSAALSGLLPNARLVVDLFHVVQLANKTVDDVRRRLTYERYGRRGRAGDLEYGTKNLLRRGQERLSDNARNRLLCALADLGDAGRQVGAAWRAKELLRDLAKLSPNQTGLAAARDQVSKALEAFFDFAATTGASVPEVQTFAETVSTWRAELARAVLTGHSNARSEGYNRVVKLDARNAYGYRNPDNQRLRTRCATTRRQRDTHDPGQLRRPRLVLRDFASEPVPQLDRLRLARRAAGQVHALSGHGVHAAVHADLVGAAPGADAPKILHAPSAGAPCRGGHEPTVRPLDGHDDGPRSAG